MHAFKFSLIAVLSCIAMIGATPVGDSAPAEALTRRQNLSCSQLAELYSICEADLPPAACAYLCDAYKAAGCGDSC
ncbi:hypothetical protein BGY98DRAFT_1000777 [Russula aff. rugulosa BPL654]|nr:hypothetical protein BGY98DRAFT_1000777 [Russula aff. rugulosa BPL654]